VRIFKEVKNMKIVLGLGLILSSATTFAQQGHNALDGTGIKAISFLEGDWHGKQNFVTGGPALVGDIVNSIQEAVGGRYLEEKLSTTLPGRKPTDSRHFITFDKKANVYKAWWFNDTSVGPMTLEGTLSDGKLVFQSAPGGPAGAPVFRATYKSPAAKALEYTFELQTPSGWQLLFTSSYTK